MTPTPRAVSFLPFLLAGLLAGCGPTQASKTIGSTGGAVSIAGLTVDVPAGAVPQTVTITVREVEARHGLREFQVEPAELELASEVELHLESESAEAELEVTRVEHETSTRVEDQGDDRHGSHHAMHCKVRKLGTFAVRSHGGHSESPLDGGGDDWGYGEGHGADDADGGDRHGAADAGDDQPGDDHGGEADAGDDHGGAADAGDDHGGPGTDAGAGAACSSDDACACGASCVAGACTTPVTCQSDAQCGAGTHCKEGKRHGQACGVSTCEP